MENSNELFKTLIDIILAGMNNDLGMPPAGRAIRFKYFVGLSLDF